MTLRLLLMMGLLVISWLAGWVDCSSGRKYCTSECQPGETYCTQNGLMLCQNNVNSGCSQWQVQACPTGQVCTAQPPPAGCRGQQTCNQPFHQKQCSGQSLFWADNCGRLREQILVCPSHTICRNGSCERDVGNPGNNNNTGKSCTDQCTLGAKQCTSTGWVSVCSPSATTTCTEWSVPVPCPHQRYCANGECSQNSCQDACTRGQTQCLGPQIQACVQGSKGCTEWGAAYPCLPGQICQNGQCVQEKSCYDACKDNETRCSGDYIQVCRRKANGCLEWDAPQTCPAGQKCLDGFCRVPKNCQDECNNGETRCSGAQIQVCQNGPSGCTVWSKAYPCLTGQSCQNGRCVADGCPGTCASDTDCQKPMCGSRNTCGNGTCVVPQPQCPPSCQQDTDCHVSGCGNRTACVQNTCQARQQQCPGSCSQDSECQIPACGSWTSCIQSRCSLPQSQCPGSCSQDSECQVSACGSRRSCQRGQCTTPAGPEPTIDAGPEMIPEAPPEPPPVQDTNPNNGGWNYGKNLPFFNFPAQNTRTNAAWGPVLTDIVNHEAPGDSNPYSDLVTKGHETSHGIHSYLRNNYNKTGKTANGFYLLQGRSLIVVEPPMRKSVIAQYIPSNLQGSRYSLYITGSTSWDDRPLYVYDEWVAYVNGAASGVDLVKQGKWTYGWRDAVMGPLEFMVYGIATAMAVEKHAASYFTSYPLFLDFTAWLSAESMRYYREGAVMNDFKWAKQDTYLQELQTSAAAKPMRDFCVRVFGQTWTDQVIFGKP